MKVIVELIFNNRRLIKACSNKYQYIQFCIDNSVHVDNSYIVDSFNIADSAIDKTCYVHHFIYDN